jgi:hypothetical protein
MRKSDALTRHIALPMPYRESIAPATRIRPGKSPVRLFHNDPYFGVITGE